MIDIGNKVYVKCLFVIFCYVIVIINFIIMYYIVLLLEMASSASPSDKIYINLTENETDKNTLKDSNQSSVLLSTALLMLLNFQIQQCL